MRFPATLLTLLILSVSTAFAVPEIPSTGKDSGDRLFEICLLRGDSEIWDLGHSLACCSHEVGACIVCEKGATGECQVISHGDRSGPKTPADFDDIFDGTSNTVVIEPTDPPFEPFMRDELFEPGTTIVAPNNVRSTFEMCMAADDRRVRLSVPYNSRVQCCSASLDFCFQCRQDGRGNCTTSPFSREWAGQKDGYTPITVTSPNENARPRDDGPDPIIID